MHSVIPNDHIFDMKTRGFNNCNQVTSGALSICLDVLQYVRGLPCLLASRDGSDTRTGQQHHDLGDVDAVLQLWIEVFKEVV